MIRRAKRRDACEKAIVIALKNVGASVSQLDGTGLPDLLVGYAGRTYLIECKDPELGDRNSRAGGSKAGSGRKVANPLGLRDSQYAWWTAWKGATVAIVTSPAGALCAIAGVIP